jgi:hypothetical protein
MLALAGTAAIFCRCQDDPAAANPAIPLLTLRWSFPAKRASVVSRTASLAGLLLSAASAPQLPWEIEIRKQRRR